MKSFILMACLVLVIGGCAGQEPFETPADNDWTAKPAAVPFSKIGRGLVNVVTSPAELWATPMWLSEEGNLMPHPVVVGIPQGLCNMGGRIVGGVVEIVSFPLYRQRMPLYNHRYGVWIFADDESVDTGE
jgi:putative exosortase-associated protein (TIGR04073 family)